jgi:hypothetical protein
MQFSLIPFSFSLTAEKGMREKPCDYRTSSSPSQGKEL